VANLEALRALRPESRLLLAVALLYTPRSEEALEMFREMRQERKGDPMLELLFAQALLMKGKSAEAAEAAQKAVQSGGNSELGQIGRLQQAQLAMDARDWNKAEELCREVLQSAKNPGIKVTAHMGRAGALYKLGRTTEAIKVFGEASRISQQIPSGHVLLAQQREQVKDLKGAESILGRGLKEDPDNAALLVYAIGFLQRLGRERENDARVIRQKLRQARLPNDNPSLVKLGRDAMRIKDYPVAEKAFRKFLQDEPDHFEVNVNLAITLNHLKRPKDAEAIASKFVKTRPDSHWLHLALGWALYEQQRLTEAEGPLRKAHELNPNDGERCLMLGDTLRRLTKTAEAEKYLRRGLKLAPNFAPGYDWLSEVLRTQGHDDEAKKMLRKAEELRARQAP
jgi:tetratricopeptide (TPR) repeat protein